MIRRFLKGLPYELTQPMFREYESKVRDLRHWTQNSKSGDVRSFLIQHEQIEFIFALGIYYRYVIAPSIGTSEFIKRLNTGFNAGLQIGGQPIAKAFRESIDSAARDFSRICKNFGLPETFFAETDSRRIILALIRLEKRRNDEQ